MALDGNGSRSTLRMRIHAHPRRTRRAHASPHSVARLLNLCRHRRPHAAYAAPARRCSPACTRWPRSETLLPVASPRIAALIPQEPTPAPPQNVAADSQARTGSRGPRQYRLPVVVTAPTPVVNVAPAIAPVDCRSGRPVVTSSTPELFDADPCDLGRAASPRETLRRQALHLHGPLHLHRQDARRRL